MVSSLTIISNEKPWHQRQGFLLDILKTPRPGSHLPADRQDYPHPRAYLHYHLRCGQCRVIKHPPQPGTHGRPLCTHHTLNFHKQVSILIDDDCHCKFKVLSANYVNRGAVSIEAPRICPKPWELCPRSWELCPKPLGIFCGASAEMLFLCSRHRRQQRYELNLVDFFVRLQFI